MERELKALVNFEENISELLTLTSRSHSLFKARKQYEKSENKDVINTITDLMRNMYDKGLQLNTLSTKIKFYLRNEIEEEKILYDDIDKVTKMVFKSWNNIENNEEILDQFQLIRNSSKKIIEKKRKEIEQEYQAV